MVVEKTNTQTNNKVIPAGGWRSRRLFRVYKQSPRTRKKEETSGISRCRDQRVLAVLSTSRAVVAVS